MFEPLINGFIKSLNSYPDRPALKVNDLVLSYEQLADYSMHIGRFLDSIDDNEIALVLGYRSKSVYQSILGVHLAGKGYVPLHPGFPVERNLRMVSMSKAKTILVSKEGENLLRELMPLITEKYNILMIDCNSNDQWIFEYPNHNYYSKTDIETVATNYDFKKVDPDSVAYLLFTSGSTGIPKGVPVKQKNVCSYVRYISELYDVGHEDRFSQTFDLTFDLSVHDMFVCWEKGACLCVTPEKSVMAPSKYIKSNEITFWFSVPAAARYAMKLRMLKPNSFPTLKYSLFCGEPLTCKIAENWQAAAPNSKVENLYGPTEATIAITRYPWDPETSAKRCHNGLVPIGWPFAGQDIKIVNQNNEDISYGNTGELLLGGSQITGAYLDDPNKTREKFIRLPSSGDNVWYHTGDLVRQDSDGCIFYEGRVDNQVQIRGYRVEIEEVDSALREASNCDNAVAIPLIDKDGQAEAIYAFVVESEGINEKIIIERCIKLLPEYMVPRRIFFIDDIPLNVNKKVDRNELGKLLNEIVGVDK